MPLHQQLPLRVQLRGAGIGGPGHTVGRFQPDREVHRAGDALGVGPIESGEVQRLIAVVHVDAGVGAQGADLARRARGAVGAARPHDGGDRQLMGITLAVADGDEQQSLGGGGQQPLTVPGRRMGDGQRRLQHVFIGRGQPMQGVDRGFRLFPRHHPAHRALHVGADGATGIPLGGRRGQIRGRDVDALEVQDLIVDPVDDLDRGRHVVLAKAFGGPTVTNDGVTIARDIDLEDPFENLGAQLVKSVATKTNDVAGDGTTTATVLAQALVRAGLKNIAAGANPIAIGSGIAKAADAVSEALLAQATPVSGEQAIAQVATVSSRDEEIGEMVGKALTTVGKDGVVTVEESSTLQTELVVTEGVQFDKGYLSPYFVTDTDTQQAVFEDAYVLLHREKISSLPDFLPLLEKIAESGKPVLIIAEDVEGEALSTLVVNAIRKTIKAVAVKAPFFGDRRKAFLDDLAVVTAGTVVNPDLGINLREAGLEVLGKARRVVVTKDDTTIIDGAGTAEDIAARGAQLRREIEATDSDWDREKLEERLAKLAGGVAVIKVGAATETALKERKYRVEDAVSAAKAAVEEGIVPGGGTALVQASTKLVELRDSLSGDEAVGVEVVRQALRAPLFWIATNAGVDGSVVVSKVAEGKEGFNAATLSYGDLLTDGVVDPVKVTRSAVINAASVARMVLTTESAIVDKPADEGDDHGHGHSH